MATTSTAARSRWRSKATRRELAAVVPVDDSLYGEVGHAYVVPAKDASLDADSLLDFARQRLANYKLPKQVVLTDDIPRLPIGKVDKRALKDRVAADRSVTGRASR